MMRMDSGGGLSPEDELHQLFQHHRFGDIGIAGSGEGAVSSLHTRPSSSSASHSDMRSTSGFSK